jgi:hypothetical protein
LNEGINSPELRVETFRIEGLISLMSRSPSSVNSNAH